MSIDIRDAEVLLMGGLFLLAIGVALGFVARDARLRGKPPILVAVLVMLTFPLGLLLWIILRPEPLNGSGRNQSFRLEDHRLQ